MRQDPPDRHVEEVQRRLQRTLRDIAALDHLVEVAQGQESETQTYVATVTCARPYPGNPEVTIDVGLLTRPGSTQAVKGDLNLTVRGLDLADITPCVTVAATSDGVTESTVVLARLAGAPSGRLDAVIARQVNDREKFMQLLMLLLSLGDPAALAALLEGRQQAGDGSASPMWIQSGGVLELVMRGLGERGSAIHDIDRLVQTVLEPDVLPEGFAEFWTVVTEAQRILERDS